MNSEFIWDIFHEFCMNPAHKQISREKIILRNLLNHQHHRQSGPFLEGNEIKSHLKIRCQVAFSCFLQMSFVTKVTLRYHQDNEANFYSSMIDLLSHYQHPSSVMYNSCFHTIPPIFDIRWKTQSHLIDLKRNNHPDYFHLFDVLASEDNL